MVGHKILLGYSEVGERYSTDLFGAIGACGFASTAASCHNCGLALRVSYGFKSLTQSSHFSQDTALVAGGEGLWHGQIEPNWNIGDNPNGGYLVAVVLGAVRQLTPEHPDPLSVTTHFLRPGVAGVACDVHVELVRRGRTLTTARAKLVQAGKTRVEVLTAFGNLGAGQKGGEDEAPPQVTLAPPSIAPPQECPERSGEAQGVELPILDRVEIRVNPADSIPAGSGSAEISGWIRLRDQTPTNSIAAVTFSDAFPPALFGLLGVIGWVPTIELTVHVRRRPTTPWLLGRFVTDDLQGARMIESGALWDENGHLVAQSRQLGLLLGQG